MNAFRNVVLTLGLILGSASACDVEEVEDIEVLDVERAAALSCSAINNSTTVCIGESVCTWTDHHGETHYREMPDEGCAEHETEIPTTSVNMACDAAANLTEDPTCPAGCAGPITTKHKNNPCCTAKKTCYDPPAPVPADDAEPAEGEQAEPL